jgi:hypothetical protein
MCASGRLIAHRTGDGTRAVISSVAKMVDESRRGRLLAVKLCTLIREHGVAGDLRPAPFALGAAAIDG